MTRRQGVLALVIGTVRLLAGGTSALAGQASRVIIRADQNPQLKQAIMVDLTNFIRWDVKLGSEVIHLSSEEIFAALKEGQ